MGKLFFTIYFKKKKAKIKLNFIVSEIEMNKRKNNLNYIFLIFCEIIKVQLISFVRPSFLLKKQFRIMKNWLKLIFLIAMVLCFSPNSNAFVVDVKPAIETPTDENFSKEKVHKSYSKKELRKLKWQERKAKRMENRLAKFQKKWEMRTTKKRLKKDKKRRRFFGGATDDMRFKIGLILFVASLLIGIFARVPLFGGLFGILAGLTGVVGLVLMFLALLEYY